MFLVLGGCFSSTARDYADYVDDLNNRSVLVPMPTADTAQPSPPPTVPVTPPVPTFAAQCSAVDGELVDVVFTNQLGIYVDLYYVYPDCSTQNVVLMAPGDTYARTTHIGGVWRARDAFGSPRWVFELRVEVGETNLVMP